MCNPEEFEYAVIPDSHGQYERIAPIVEALDPQVDKFLFLGDIIDGPDSRRLIQMIRDLGEKAIPIIGNHEWALRNALTEGDDPLIDIWRTEFWPRYENRMLYSYGRRRSSNWENNADFLRDAMAENGDLKWIDDLPPFFENNQFIAVHAGPITDIPWKKQAKFLLKASLESNRLSNEPEQIFSHQLADYEYLPENLDNRIFVTGHSHLKIPMEERITNNRIRLATKITPSSPIYVWNSQQNKIIEF